MDSRGIKRYFMPVNRNTGQSPVTSSTRTNSPTLDSPTKSIATDNVSTPTAQRRAPSSHDSHQPSTPSHDKESNYAVKRPRLESTPIMKRDGGKQTPRTPRVVNNQQDVDEDETHHLHRTYKFLYPPHRRDIEGRAPDDPDYDEKTLKLPTGFLDQQTPALRQWWLIKQRNMDAILFFKMGKFYELFNEDAVIGVNKLDIMYMKGDDSKPAHAGFPEVSYDKYARMLIELGYKVLRIEQTETPAMMEERCQRTGKKGKFDRVVNREICRVTTKGTQMLGINETVFHSSLNQYLLAIYLHTGHEGYDNHESCGNRSRTLGISFVDVTIGRIYIGQFDDDNNLSKFNILLAHHSPTEIVYAKGNPDAEMMQAMSKTGALLTSLKMNSDFWTTKKLLTRLKSMGDTSGNAGDYEWPETLKRMFQEGETSDSLIPLEPKDEYKFGLSSFGAIVSYLDSQLILDQVIRGACFEVYYPPVDYDKAALSTLQRPPMILDHIALRNLEIFTDSSGEHRSTLFDSINHCRTHFGQRLLKNWICCPLQDAVQINNRLDAVEAMITNDNASLVNEIIHVLEPLPDLERLLSKIKSQCFKSESDSRAIMFDGDQYSKVKINSFLNLLHNFKRLYKFIKSIRNSAKRCNSQILCRLLTFTTDDGLFPDYTATLDYFEGAFDHNVARKTGKIIPSLGVDRNYDEYSNKATQMENKLRDYLEEQKQALGCRNIQYFGTGKNRFQIEVPEAYCKNVPYEYRIESTRKGYKRYYTTAIDKMFAKLTTYEEEVKRALDNVMSNIFGQFASKVKLWNAAIDCTATLDVLQSIASFVRSLKANNVDVCRPKILSGSCRPMITYRSGRHPSLVKFNPDFVANDVELDDKLLLLSGANMGGKSTLMRQTALLVILAQIGCYVPAKSMEFTPVDRIFSRLGASDRLLEGESTFYTELIETSAMMSCATNRSLLLLDELGRGTATYDGTAIAYSVIKEISENLKCRCLFSTHYHSLVCDFRNSAHVRLGHMACKVERNSNSDEDLHPLKEEITFLYKLAAGPAARSYGFNIARLAGIDGNIIHNAFVKAKEMEYGNKVLNTLQDICRSDPDVLHDDSLKAKVIALSR